MVEFPEPYSYRNKTQMPFQYSQKQISYGLFKMGTHEIFPIQKCLVESDEANVVLKTICKWAKDYNIDVYDESSRQGFLRYGVIRKGQFTNQLMVIIVATTMELPFLNELIGLLKDALPSLRSIILNINSGVDNVVLGKRNIKIWGSGYIEEKLGNITYKIFPNTFFQTNSIQMKRILNKIIKLGDFSKNDQVLDLFCGVGTIGLYLAGNIRELIGLENNKESIEAAKQNCVNNNISNASFIYRDLSKGFSSLLPRGFSPDYIIADPPRKGLTSLLIQKIIRSKPKGVIYLSCNPTTLVRDLAIFYNFQYFTDNIFPFDMFPHTSHIESLVFLKKG